MPWPGKASFGFNQTLVGHQLWTRILIGNIPLWLGLLSLFLFSCRDSVVLKEAGKVHLSGKIFSGTSSGKQVKLLDAIDREMVTDDIENGAFDLNILIDEAGYYTLRIGKVGMQLYLAPNYDLILEYEELTGKITVSGRGSESNRYIREFEEFERNNKPAYNQLLARSEDDFLLEARRYRSKSEGFLNNFQAKNVNLDPNFISKERSRILYAWANQLTHYPEAHIFYTGGDEFVVSANYHDYKKTVNLDAFDLLSLPEYQTFVISYIDSEAELLRKKGDKRSPDQIRFDVAMQDISESKVKEFAMFAILRRSLEQGLNEVTDSLLKIFYQRCENSILLAEIRLKEDQWKRIAPGKRVPEISANTRAGAKVSLEDWDGKYLYLIFGASWCVPCQADYQLLTQVSELSDTNSIRVISLSIDQDKGAWEQSLKSRSLSWIVEAIVAPKYLEEIREIFMLRSLPRYVLIDDKGRIVDSMAPGPNDPALQTLLLAHSVASN